MDDYCLGSNVKGKDLTKGICFLIFLIETTNVLPETYPHAEGRLYFLYLIIQKAILQINKKTGYYETY